MFPDLRRDVGILKLYALFSTLAFVVLLTTGAGRENPRFEEIDVERINIVEADGSLRMVISNKARQHPGIVNGQLIEREHPRPPGLLFFNHVGDEMGGLVFDENGETGQFGQFSFDKFGNDQTIGLRHLESDNGAYAAGLVIWQQPNVSSREMMAGVAAADSISDAAARRRAFQELRETGRLTTERMYIGKYRNDVALVSIADPAGNPRLRIMVDADGTPVIEFLDPEGNVTRTLSDGQ